MAVSVTESAGAGVGPGRMFVVGTSLPTTSSCTSSTNSSPGLLSRAPKVKPIAFAGTSSTTETWCQSLVPVSSLPRMSSRASIKEGPSTRIHSAPLVIAMWRTQPDKRTRLPRYAFAASPCATFAEPLGNSLFANMKAAAAPLLLFCLSIPTV